METVQVSTLAAEFKFTSQTFITENVGAGAERTKFLAEKYNNNNLDFLYLAENKLTDNLETEGLSGEAMGKLVLLVHTW